MTTAPALGSNAADAAVVKMLTVSRCGGGLEPNSLLTYTSNVSNVVKFIEIGIVQVFDLGIKAVVT